jgi:hypothetical protein
MPHPLQNRRWMFFFPGAFLRQLTLAMSILPGPVRRG